jgi:TRAP-type C4-dicarboxylate transport system permease small subunit
MKIIADTGARRWLVWLSLLTCLAMAGILCVYIYQNSKPALITMIGLLPVCFALEWAYRKRTGRIMKSRIS